MSLPKPTCPMPRDAVVDTYFLEHRAKLIDIAAFLDRVDRAASADGGGDDFRMVAMRKAIAILQESHPDRARRVLDCFSDHTTEMIESAAGSKGAVGAPPVDDSREGGQ